MSSRLCSSRAVVLTVAAALIIASMSPSVTGQDDSSQGAEIASTLTVRGYSELKKPADRLLMSIGVVTENAEAPAALAENSERMEDVLRAIRRVGLDQDEIQTGRFSIRPVYTQRPRQAEADWTPQIMRYQVTNTLQIATLHLELAGKLIQAANEAGANSVDGIGFDLANPRTHRAEAITVATTNALDDARALADAAGVRLVRIVRLNLDQISVRPFERVGAPRAMAATAEGAPAPSIVAGDVTVQATVDLVYEIGPRE